MTPRARPSTAAIVLGAVGVAGLVLLVVLVLPPRTPPVPVSAVAVFVGDSYTRGTGASAPTQRWTSVLSAQEHWDEVNLGEGGTGYVTTAGPAGCGRSFCGDYRSRVDQAVAAHPGRVVISGGQNDLSAFAAEPDRVRAAILDTYVVYHDRLPGVEIVAVGPSTPGSVSATATALDAAVREAAVQVGARYVSLLDPPVVEPGMVTADHAHVDDAGHAAIAARVAADL